MRNAALLNFLRDPQLAHAMEELRATLAAELQKGEDGADQDLIDYCHYFLDHGEKELERRNRKMRKKNKTREEHTG